ncbi:MAG: hypothetical protein NVS9B10_19770 [Nevskia sp.]
MTTDDTSLDSAATSQPYTFASDLIRQLYADLDGLLFEPDLKPADDAFALVEQAAEAARPRGAVLLILLRAALTAHHAISGDADMPDENTAVAEASGALVEMLPNTAAQLPALQAHALRLTQYLGIAEQSNEAIHAPVARAIQRFCAALGDEDSATGSRALFELRSLVVHLDASAAALDAAGATAEPLRVIRPDRFHDYFMRYSSLAQNPESATREQPLAALSLDGRISAVITSDRHPLEAAAQSLRETIVGDDITRDHALSRIRALLDVLDGLRRAPLATIGDALNDTTVHLSLVIAAATTPLHASSGFALPQLAQVARYNQRLLRGAMPSTDRPH